MYVCVSGFVDTRKTRTSGLWPFIFSLSSLFQPVNIRFERTLSTYFRFLLHIKHLRGAQLRPDWL
jgi:hypothetical protein